MASYCAAALAGLLGLVGAVVAQAEPLVETGPHFVVQFHRAQLPEMLALRLSAAALATAEATWPLVERQLLARPGTPATIHVHARERDFRDVEKTVTGAGNLRELVVRHANQDAHVLLWPPLEVADLELTGLPVSTQELVLRAAAELLAAQKSTAVAVDPWLAEVFAFAVLEGKSAQPAKYGVDPLFDSRRYRHADAATRPSLRSWVVGAGPLRTRDERVLADEGKVLAAQLLASGGGDWARRFLQSPARPGDTAKIVREAAVERVLGSDWVKIDARWQKQLAAIEVPYWVQAPVLQTVGKRWLLVGTPDHAFTVTGPPLPAGPYRIRGSGEATRADDDGLRIQLGWDGTSLVGIFLGPRAVTISTWQAGKPWADLVAVKSSIRAGKLFDFAIEVGAERDRLVVSIDGEQVVRCDCSGRDMHGVWQLAKNHCAFWLEGLRVEAVPAK